VRVVSVGCAAAVTVRAARIVELLPGDLPQPLAATLGEVRLRGESLDAGFGRLWAADPDRGLVTWLDPATGETAEIEVEGAAVVVVGAEEVFVATEDGTVAAFAPDDPEGTMRTIRDAATAGTLEVTDMVYGNPYTMWPEW